MLYIFIFIFSIFGFIIGSKWENQEEEKDYLPEDHMKKKEISRGGGVIIGTGFFIWLIITFFIDKNIDNSYYSLLFVGFTSFLIGLTDDFLKKFGGLKNIIRLFCWSFIGLGAFLINTFPGNLKIYISCSLFFYYAFFLNFFFLKKNYKHDFNIGSIIICRSLKGEDLAKTKDYLFRGVFLLLIFNFIFIFFSFYLFDLKKAMFLFILFNILCIEDIFKFRKTKFIESNNHCNQKTNFLFKKQFLLNLFVFLLVFLFILRSELCILIKNTDLIHLKTLVPFFGFLNLKYLAIPFSVFFIVSVINGVNMTDGLDGLVTVPLIFNFLFIFIISKGQGVIGQTSLVIILILAVFLYFNKKPAKIFMGDSGAIFLGGILGCLYSILKIEFFFPVVGFVFFINALTSSLQIFSIRLLKKKIFKMAPIHHHFQLSGYKETTIVYITWALSFFIFIIGLFLYFL